MTPTIHQLGGIDHETILALVERLERAYPDSNLGCARTSTKRYGVIGEGKVRGRVALLPFSSGKDLLDHDCPALAALAAEVRKVLPAERSWNLEAWANVLRRGDWFEEHDHVAGENQWSAIYYLAAPAGSRLAFGEDKIDVKTGMLLLFPAAAKHRVPICDGAGQRVSIAFNAWPAPAGAA